MASQDDASYILELLEISSFIRGYHAYQDVWTPMNGESLLVKREPTNVKDENAVGIYKDGIIVGHVPYNLSLIISHFLRCEVNKAFAKVTCDKVNRGAGYGLEVPCKYQLYGPRLYIDKMKEFLQN